MKKFFSLLGVLTMILSLCACGAPKTIADACKKADSLVEKWDKDSKNLSGYKSEYNSESQLYFVTTYSLTAADETDFAKEYNAKRNCKFVYEELKNVFSNVDVGISVMMLDENQNVYYLTLDGKPLDVEDLK